jgi:hypothetical protein
MALISHVDMEVHPGVLGKSRCLFLGRSHPIRSKKGSDDACLR